MDEHAFVASGSDEDDSDGFVNPPPKQHNVKPSQTARLPCLSRMSSMFGATSSCVININFGQSNTNVEYKLNSYEQDDIPEDMERALAEVDFEFK